MTLAARILAVLGETPLPADTPMLVALCGAGRPNARSQVWATLRRLERDGLVKKADRLGACRADGFPNRRSVRWTLA